MGFFKWMCKKFKCQSSCMFNDANYCDSIQHTKLSDYELKYKDIEAIHKILIKRRLKNKIIAFDNIIDI